MPFTDSATADLSGYVPLENNRPAAPAPSTDLQPGRSPTMRCPLPILGQATPDSLRGYYLKGNVPQTRLLTPQAVNTNSGSTTTTGVITTSSSGSSGSTTTIVAKQATVTTAVLSPNSKFTSTIGMTRSYQLLSLSVSSSARVQLYGTSVAQSADLSRGLDVPPAAGTAQNIICDVVLDTAPTIWSFQSRMGANADTPQSTVTYITVTNLDTNSDAITVTIQYVPFEA